MGQDQKQRIAVLGGGIGALSAVFYLTEEPGWQDKYDITVYQQGWRLGGKCASGHDMRPGYGNRIYEHGLHIFAGWYDQAFDLLRRAYDAVGRPPDHPNSTVWQAFSPQDTITLMDRDAQGNPTRPWLLDLSPNFEKPGDTLDIPAAGALIKSIVEKLLHFPPGGHRAACTDASGDPVAPGDPIHACRQAISSIIEKIEDAAEDEIVRLGLRAVVDLVEGYTRSIYHGLLGPGGEFRLNQILMGIFLLQTIITGVSEDRVLERGYDSLDGCEWSEWLHKHALAVASRYPEWGDPKDRARDLVDWTPMSSLYDYAFAYNFSGGDLAPSFAAGTALRSALLMVSYKGHFFYTMRGAMGDVVVAPIYLALVKRGVKFKFFSRITALNIDNANDSLESIDYVEQAALKDPGRGYRPLVDIPVPGWKRPVEGWPIEPLWDQLENGEALAKSGRNFESDHLGRPGMGDVPRRLRTGVDFDRVILGISVGGLKQVCSSFPVRLPNSKWGPMFGALTLTQTCAMQIWTRRSVSDLGSDSSRRTITGAAQAYSTWSDMSHLLDRENWRGDERPLSVIYFCGQIAGFDDLEKANKTAQDAAVSWLKANASLYWDMATSPDSPYGLDPELIFDPDPGAGGDALSRQYARANANPSDLYVQSPVNSVYTRMDANESGLSNLFLTGDWTRNGINSGCAEAAARSGWRCAQAIAGKLEPLTRLLWEEQPV